MNKTEFYRKFLYFPIPKQYLDKIWQWIEQYGKEQRIDELNRQIDLIIHLPDSQYDDLEIKRICENRIKELKDE